MATGDLITFVDSDDYLAPNTYAPLLDIMGDADILEYSIANRLKLEEHTYNSCDDYWLTTKAYQHTYACNKIYRRQLFSDLRYPKGKVFEDAYTLPLLLQKARKIITTSHGFYHYCYNQEGITATANGQALSMLLDAHLHNQMPMDDEYYMYLVNIQMDVWERTGAPIKLPPRRVNANSLKGIKRVKAITINTLGINILCRINKFIHHFRKANLS